MTELHLDEDEWATILLAIKCERDKADGEYHRYLDALVLKLEIALAPATV